MWDHDGVRDDLRDCVVGHLGDAGAVLVVDETGDVKKRSHSVGLQRQYTSTAGRIENSQVAVYLSYATDAGHAPSSPSRSAIYGTECAGRPGDDTSTAPDPATTSDEPRQNREDHDLWPSY